MYQMNYTGMGSAFPVCYEKQFSKMSNIVNFLFESVTLKILLPSKNSERYTTIILVLEHIPIFYFHFNFLYLKLLMSQSKFSGDQKITLR